MGLHHNHRHNQKGLPSNGHSGCAAHTSDNRSRVGIAAILTAEALDQVAREGRPDVDTSSYETLRFGHADNARACPPS